MVDTSYGIGINIINVLILVYATGFCYYICRQYIRTHKNDSFKPVVAAFVILSFSLILIQSAAFIRAYNAYIVQGLIFNGLLNKLSFVDRGSVAYMLVLLTYIFRLIKGEYEKHKGEIRLLKNKLNRQGL